MTGASTPQLRIRLGVCLSLTGRFARFGRQVAAALQVWQAMDGAVDLVIEDDESDPRTVERLLPRVAERSHILLGPYATNLTRAASNVAADNGWLLWNHGGSGDDIQSAYPGHLVSVLTPTSRYAEPFLEYHLDAGNGMVVITRAQGSFGRQVAVGAAAHAAKLGIEAVNLGLDQEWPSGKKAWVLFSAGTFEDDIANVKRAQLLTNPPSIICSVAAGVHEFGDTVENARGFLGIAQWFPGSGEVRPGLGPMEQDFLTAYSTSGHPSPDYPANSKIKSGTGRLVFPVTAGRPGYLGGLSSG